MGGQERWEGRLEAVNTERTAKTVLLEEGIGSVCVCMCFTLSDYDAYHIGPLTYQCAETYYRVSM